MFDQLTERSGLSLERLMTLCQIAEAGGIGAAAGGDPSRQSQYSRQVSDLEGFLGIDLLDRRSRPSRLTEQGLEFAKLARGFLEALNDFAGRCRDEPGRLTIGAGDSQVQWLLIPGLLPTLQAQLPNTTLRFRNLQTEEIVAALKSGELDLGLVRENAVAAGLEKAGAWRQSYRLFVPKRLRTRLKEPVTVRQLETLPLAVLESQGEFRHRLGELAEESGVRLRFVAQASSSVQVASVVSEGHCCAILPSFAASQLDPKAIDSFSVAGFKRLDRKLCIAWSPRRAEIRPIIEQAAQVCAAS